MPKRDRGTEGVSGKKRGRTEEATAEDIVMVRGLQKEKQKKTDKRKQKIREIKGLDIEAGRQKVDRRDGKRW